MEYFVSYYDYYQPEAYVPQTDTYIEKDSSINDDINVQVSTSSSLISKEDVIVIASVSCIYGLGSPDDFKTMMLVLKRARTYLGIVYSSILLRFIIIVMIRFKRGTFRVRGDVIDVFPAYLETGVR